MSQSVEYYSANRKQSVPVQGVFSGRQRSTDSPGDSCPDAVPASGRRVAAAR